MTEAASVLIWTDDGRVLGITRGFDAQNISMPGGRRDPEDASVAHTAARELHEETGVVVSPEDLRPLMRNGSHTTFYTTQIRLWPDRLSSYPFEGFPALWPAQKLLGSRCWHAEQHALLFEMVGISA